VSPCYVEILRQSRGITLFDWNLSDYATSVCPDCGCRLGSNLYLEYGYF